MSITEHLAAMSTIIVEQKLPSELRGHIVAMTEQIQAYEQEAANLGALKAENTELKSKVQVLEAENLILKNPPIFHHPLGLCFTRGPITGNQWRQVCPRCNKPASVQTDGSTPQAYCVANCGWQLWLPQGTTEAALLASCPQ
jgi:hypothetical protein